MAVKAVLLQLRRRKVCKQIVFLDILERWSVKLSKNIFEILDGGSLSSVESVSDLGETPEIPVSVFFRRPIGEFVVHDHFHIFIS